MKRKCDGFIFKCIYARGIENTTDAISRIETWEEYDSDRLPSVDDNKDADDNSIQLKREEKKRTINKLKKYNANSNKLMILNDMSENWNTTLDKVKLQVLLNMYASTDFNPDDASFDKEIEDLDACRDKVLRCKPLACYDNDNAVMCSAGHEELTSRNSCVNNCSIENTEENIVMINDSREYKVNFNADIRNNKVNAVSWEDFVFKTT